MSGSEGGRQAAQASEYNNFQVYVLCTYIYARLYVQLYIALIPRAENTKPI